MIGYVAPVVGIILFAMSGYLLLRQFQVLGILLLLGSSLLFLSQSILIAMDISQTLDRHLTLALLMQTLWRKGMFLVSAATLLTIRKLTGRRSEAKSG